MCLSTQIGRDESTKCFVVNELTTSVDNHPADNFLIK